MKDHESRGHRFESCPVHHLAARELRAVGGHFLLLLDFSDQKPQFEESDSRAGSRGPVLWIRFVLSCFFLCILILFLIQTKLCHVIVLKASHVYHGYWNPMLRRIALPLQGDTAQEGA